LSIHGLSGVLIVYMIHRDPKPNMPLPSHPMQLQIVQVPIWGPLYLANQQKVYQIICDAVSGTNGWTWIHDIKYTYRHLAMSKLRQYYNGAGSKTHQIQDSKEHLKSCHYMREMTFSFEKYVMALKECVTHSKKMNAQSLNTTR